MNNGTQMYIDLGEVVCAKKIFLHLRGKSRQDIKSAKSRYESATKEYNDFGMYGDGDSYVEWRQDAKTKFQNALENRIKFVVSSEKYFKKLKHKFIETYPSFEWMLEEFVNKAIEDSKVV